MLMSHSCPWPVGPDHPVLKAGDVHVWYASLEQDPAPFAPLLSADERERAGRFRFEPDRRKFTVARGVLRILLGRYLGLEPASLAFSYTELRKPWLPAHADWKFNISHSGEAALYALTLHHQIGVDIEQIRPIDDAQQLARRFFAPEECDELQAAPPEKQLEVFFSGWTRKEAWIKARGDGLHYPLDGFAVRMDPLQPPTLLRAREGQAELKRWSLVGLNPLAGYQAALAVESDSQHLTCWRWEQ